MSASTAAKPRKPKPVLSADCCKGCGRCIDSCAHHCIEEGTAINPATGLVPVSLHLEDCTACGLCFDACPEPYGLRPDDAPPLAAYGESAASGSPAPAESPSGGRPSRSADHVSGDSPSGGRPSRSEGRPVGGVGGSEAPWLIAAPHPQLGRDENPRSPWRDVPPHLNNDAQLPLPASAPLVVKGNHAAAIGAILAGCRHVFGYPITPSTEGAELLAKILPGLGGVFLQAPSEVATVNMMYGCGGAGLRSLTFTSSPGFSLMLEGISYMVGAEVPGVFVNVMRGGPGLGNIAPEQSDVKLACRGLGHGNSHGIVLAPATPQEMLDLTMLAFELSFRYRNPVVVLADGYLGQMTGRVELPRSMVKPALPAWAVWGDAGHRGNLISSIRLLEADLEAFNRRLNAKYARIAAAEQRADLYRCDDAEVLVVAANTPARMAKGAVRMLRDAGWKVGLFRPVTLWPFPIRALQPLLAHARRIVVVEAGPGQIEDEMRLALSHAGIAPPAIDNVRRYGGVLPQPQEILDKVLGAGGTEEEVRA